MYANHVYQFEMRCRHKDLPVVMCGDFNSQPQLNHNEIKYNPNGVSLTFHGGEQSGVYKLLDSGYIDSSHLHHPTAWNPTMNDGMHDIRIVGVTPDGSQRSYSSAYKAWMGTEPLFTTRTLKASTLNRYLPLPSPSPSRSSFTTVHRHD